MLMKLLQSTCVVILGTLSGWEWRLTSAESEDDDYRELLLSR
jgi:hypothetical protein